MASILSVLFTVVPALCPVDKPGIIEDARMAMSAPAISTPCPATCVLPKFDEAHRWDATAGVATTTCGPVITILQGPYTFQAYGTTIANPWAGPLEYWFSLSGDTPNAAYNSMGRNWSTDPCWTYHFHHVGIFSLFMYSRVAGDTSSTAGSRWGRMYICVQPNPRPMPEWNLPPTAEFPSAANLLTSEEWCDWDQANGKYPRPIACQWNSGSHLRLINFNDPEGKSIEGLVETPGATCNTEQNGPVVRFSTQYWALPGKEQSEANIYVNLPAPMGNAATKRETRTFQQTITLTDDLGLSTVYRRRINVDEGPRDAFWESPWRTPWAGFYLTVPNMGRFYGDVQPLAADVFVTVQPWFDRNFQQIPEVAQRPVRWEIDWGDGNTEGCNYKDEECTATRSHKYASAGTYLICHRQFNDSMLLDEYCRPVTVRP